MAGIKNINVISGTGNPVQMQDLQNLWSAINSLLRSTKTPISIVAGFATANNDTGTNIGEGIICYQGQAYYLAADVAKIGQYLYANTIQDEQRVYEDGATRYTYQDYVVNAAANASASGIGTLIGQATAANLAAWKVGVIADGSITAAMLADGAVTTAKIANGAIIDKKIANYAIGTDAIQNNAINASKIVDRAVGNSKIGLKVINRTNIADGGISTVNIADKAITAEKIADATITGTQIAGGSITNEEILDYTIDASMKMVPSSVDESCIAAAAVGSRQLQVAAVNNSALANTAVTTDKIKDDNVTPEKLAPSIRTSIPLQTQILDHATSVRQTISEGNISILKIPVSASNQAVNIQLSEEDTDILVHHWPIFIYKDTEDAFGISVNGVVGRLEISLPTSSINCVLNVYSHTGYGFVVDVGQPNFISK